jgi:HrpA-like RNA helicase
MMAPIRFNPEKDLAPTPFDEQICRLALEMKSLGLTWQPHVGCFVWDPDQTGITLSRQNLFYFEFASVYRDLRQHSGDCSKARVAANLASSLLALHKYGHRR